MSYIYNSAILGGTFDHFHRGHEKFIATALAQAKNLTIGIVEHTLSESKSLGGSIEDYSTRLKSLKSFLQKIEVEERTNVIPINDIYGKSLTDTTIEAIFVTDSTKSNAAVINIKRLELGLSPLVVVIVPFELGDDGDIISSSRIRKGEIDRHGTSYLKFFMHKDKYYLPDYLRANLQVPMGIVITNTEDIPRSSNIIAVGDIVSLNLKKANYPTAVNIIDYKTRRENIDKKEIEQYFPRTSQQLINPAGTINSSSANTILSAIAKYQKTKATQVIVVDGEEDLLALPAMLLSPLDTYIIYGQYSVGMILVKVTENIKFLAKQYLEKFN